MDEMAPIQQLARQALKTFRNVKGAQLRENLEALKTMMSSLSGQDLNISPVKKNKKEKYHVAAPVTHVDILDCPYFSMAVFIINRGQTLPLHNHPGMYGFCKVLYGQIEVEMYSNPLDSERKSNRVISNTNQPKIQKFLYQGKHTFDSKTGVCTVTPDYGNLHTISAVNGPAAFLDILGPPYSSDEGRDCQYYKECYTDEKSSDIRYLQETPCPLEFFCDSQVYTGPQVSLEDLIQNSKEN